MTSGDVVLAFTMSWYGMIASLVLVALIGGL